VEKTPITGNAALTGGAIVAVVVAIIGLLRAYGFDVTEGQQGAWVSFLESPAGDLIVLVVTIVTSFFVRANVYSRVSVAKLTGQNDPVVPASPVRVGGETIQ